MIEVTHLTKAYGPLKAVDDLTFTVQKGEVVGFLGPNGAGKSTTLRILAGFLGATFGTVRVAGFDVVDESAKARAAIGYMPESSPLYPDMRVREYLGFRAELKRVARGKRTAAVGRAIEQARVSDVADVVIGHLSKGYRQRVGLADALLGSPPLLILDEPTAGLDPNQIREVRALVRELSADHTVFLSTHILSEVETTCARALVIARGKLVAEGTIDALRSLRRSTGATIVVGAGSDASVGALEGIAGVAGSTREPRDDGSEAIQIELAAGADAPLVIEAAVAALVGAGFGVREVTPRRASLEQVFSELTAEPKAATS